jgi:hypothetical protein
VFGNGNQKEERGKRKNAKEGAFCELEGIMLSSTIYHNTFSSSVITKLFFEMSKSKKITKEGNFLKISKNQRSFLLHANFQHCKVYIHSSQHSSR